jgi:hypothetical protein
MVPNAQPETLGRSTRRRRHLWVGLIVFGLFASLQLFKAARVIWLVRNHHPTAAESAAFWQRSPGLFHVTTFPDTDLAIVRASDNEYDLGGMLDLSAVYTAQVRSSGCADLPGAAQAQYPGAGHVACYAVEPAGNAPAYRGAISFTAETSAAKVARFYQDLFSRRARRFATIEESDYALIVEAQDEHEKAVARVSMRTSFNTVYASVLWTGSAL